MKVAEHSDRRRNQRAHSPPAPSSSRGAAMASSTRARFGHFTYEENSPEVELNTIYDLASLSKSVGCASSVMVLLDKGKISVSDPVIKYLPEFDNNEKGTLTIEQLLLHRSGLVADNPMSDYKGSVEESWKNIMEQKLKAKPGEKFVYSDVNFLVLGHLVEKSSGETLDKFAHDNVFRAAGIEGHDVQPAESLRSRIAPTTKIPREKCTTLAPRR
jgi:CubicO group peptidase (beta-lactamase class C family)